MVGSTDLARSLFYNRSGLPGDLSFKFLQALRRVAMHLAYWQQVAALSVEHEEQAIEKDKRAVKIGFEQATALLTLHFLQAGINQPAAAGMHTETARNARKNVRQDELVHAVPR